jgi:hypothetical protein
MDASRDDGAAPAGDGPPPIHTRRKISVLRIIIGVALPIAVCAVLVGPCTGLIPPWPAAVAVLVGVLVTAVLVAVRKPGFGIASAILALFVFLWLLRPAIDLRAATSNDRTYDSYFGVSSDDDAAGAVTFRNIAVATGTFTLDTWLTASLYHVKSGEIHDINGFTVGRSPNQIGAPHWVDMKITLALGDRITPQGRITQLGSAGQSRGGGGSHGTVNDVDPSATRFYPGRFTPGTKRIVYVEGDSGFRVDDTMTVERFAQENKGNHLVVEVELH